MTIRRLCLATILSAAALAALPATAAQRTFVASFGNDANLCGITSPCRTFTRALTQTDPSGEVIVLDSAGYGAFVITQSVSVIAPDGVYAGISVFPGVPASHGIVVNGAGIKVTLRGLTINGQGGDDGIRIENAGLVFIEKVTIANTGNDLTDASIRVTTGAAVSGVFVTDTTLRGMAGDGMRIEASTTVQVDRSRIEGGANLGIRGLAPGGRLAVSDSLVARNVWGIGVFASASGTWIATVARSTVADNNGEGVFAGNGTNGTYRVSVTDSVVRGNLSNGVAAFAAAGETVTILVVNCSIVGNDNDGIRSETGGGAATVIADRNDVVGNGTGIHPFSGGTVASMGNNTVEKNIFGDVVGTITPATLR